MSKVKTTVEIAQGIRDAVKYMGDDLPYTVSAAQMRLLADEIEAARVPSVSSEPDAPSPAVNAAKLREALVLAKKAMIEKVVGSLDVPDDFFQDEIQAIEAALAEPPRNCDVGTAEEQAERFAEFCDDEKGNRNHCRNCRLCNARDCELAWAQMPYEEGGKRD